MKYLLSILILQLAFLASAQEKQEQKPGFFSVVLLDEQVGDYHLIANYYPLKGNLDNKMSAVYISEGPTIDEIEKAAINVTSDFFYVSKNNVNYYKIMLLEQPKRAYFVASPQTGEMAEYECLLKGDITENRANELIAEKIDSTARIDKGKLYFNKKEFVIISNKDIRAEVLALINKYQLNTLTPSVKKKPAK